MYCTCCRSRYETRSLARTLCGWLVRDGRAAGFFWDSPSPTTTSLVLECKEIKSYQIIYDHTLLQVKTKLRNSKLAGTQGHTRLQSRFTHNEKRWTNLYCRVLSMYSCCSIPGESDAETSIIFLWGGGGSERYIGWKEVGVINRQLNAVLENCYEDINTHSAVFVRMEERRACSSVGQDGVP